MRNPTSHPEGKNTCLFTSTRTSLGLTWPLYTSALTGSTNTSRAGSGGPKCSKTSTGLFLHAPPVPKPKNLVPYLQNPFCCPCLRPQSQLTIDNFTDLPPSQNNTVIMIIDRFSKSFYLLPLTQPKLSLKQLKTNNAKKKKLKTFQIKKNPNRLSKPK